MQIVLFNMLPYLLCRQRSGVLFFLTFCSSPSSAYESAAFVILLLISVVLADHLGLASLRPMNVSLIHLPNSSLISARQCCLSVITKKQKLPFDTLQCHDRSPLSKTQQSLCMKPQPSPSHHAQHLHHHVNPLRKCSIWTSPVSTCPTHSQT